MDPVSSTRTWPAGVAASEAAVAGATAGYAPRSVRQPATVGDRMTSVGVEHRVKDGVRPRSEALEIYRVDPSAQVIRTFEAIDARLDLLRFAKHNSAELEFLTPYHLVILLPDGISRGGEWSDGRRTRKLPSIPPNTIMFNPAREYLRIRRSLSQSCCRVMLLTIHPSRMCQTNDTDADLEKMRFQQQIGLDDQGVCQALVAIQQEIETPGINSTLYLEALLILLVTRLMRHASSFATLRQPIYAKGGLQNWRLKRALELLESDLAKPPSLAEVAEPLGLRPASFCRAFKQSMGVSPHHYFLAHRVNSAKEMMRDQTRSLTNISLDCGFSGSSHFSVAFKRIVGVSPREYRRSL